MASSLLRKLQALELEEKILNGGLLFAMAGMFFPWLQGRELLIDDTIVSYSGFSFYTGAIGITVFCLQVFVLLLTALPLLSGSQLVRPQYKQRIRLYCCSTMLILVLAALSVLVRYSFHAPAMEVHMGVYITLIGTMVTTLYAFLSVQEGKRKDVHEFFHQSVPTSNNHELMQEKTPPSLPSIQPTLSPEEHR